MDDNGLTVASDNLRQGADKLNEKSIYAVHAALGLSVSDILLQGCKPVIVEGASDQIYLNTIKQILISNNSISPKDEIVFVPSGGVKGIQGVVSIIGCKNTDLPYIILDSDKSGADTKAKLEKGELYSDDKKKILEIKEFTHVDNSEFEDLIPSDIICRCLLKIMPRDLDDDFEDFYESQKPIIPQIEQFALDHNVTLPKGWKVDLAKKVKAIMLKKDFNKEQSKTWKKLFDKFCK